MTEERWPEFACDKQRRASDPAAQAGAAEAILDRVPEPEVDQAEAAAAGQSLDGEALLAAQSAQVRHIFSCRHIPVYPADINMMAAI